MEIDERSRAGRRIPQADCAAGECCGEPAAARERNALDPPRRPRKRLLVLVGHAAAEAVELDPSLKPSAIQPAPGSTAILVAPTSASGARPGRPGSRAPRTSTRAPDVAAAKTPPPKEASNTLVARHLDPSAGQRELGGVPDADATVAGARGERRAAPVEADGHHRLSVRQQPPAELALAADVPEDDGVVVGAGRAGGGRRR